MDGDKFPDVPSTQTDPVEHPTMRIGDIDFKVKFTMLQVMRLEECGVKFVEDYVDDKGVTKQRQRQVWNLRDIFIGLSAMVSTAQKSYTPEELAEMVPAASAGDVFRIFATAVKKVLSQGKLATMTVQPGDAGSPTPAN